MRKARILVADDQPLIRDGLELIIDMEDDLTVVAKTGNGMATLEQFELHRPDLILLDIHMPKLDGLQVAKKIKSHHSNTKILIFTTFENEKYIWEALQYGVDGYLVKGAETKRILSTIRDCLNERLSFPSKIQPRLLKVLQSVSVESASPVSGHEQPDFTIQERNLIRLLKAGRSNQAIATELLLTKGTVKNYLTSIYRKLRVSSKSEAIAHIHKHDL